MSFIESARYILVLTMTTGFLYIVGQRIVKYTERSIGETQSTKNAAEMFFPSVYICPVFKTDFDERDSIESKNLSEYYEGGPRIRDIVLSISQSYETENG